MSIDSLTQKIIKDKATLADIISSNRKSIGDIFSPKAKEVSTTATNTPAKDSRKRRAGNNNNKIIINIINNKRHFLFLP